MQKWNLLKKTAPCILSLAVAATTFPTAVMASDFDAAVFSEAEAGDTEDFSTEETAEDTEAVAEEAIEDAADITEEAAEDVAVPEAAADETEDIQQEDTEAVETLDETAEEADPFSTGEEDFTEGDEVAEAFSDSDQLTGEYQYVYAGLTWGEYWAAEGVYAAGDTSSSEEKDSHSEFDTGAFDTVTRATANHGLHRGSYQTEATRLDVISGGGLNNYTERRRKGYVTDYVSLNVENPKLKKVVFNISDLFIFTGALLWGGSEIFSEKEK